MPNFCKLILKLDKEIRIAMIVDTLGNVECIATQKTLEVPEELLRRFGGAWSAVAGGIFMQLTHYLGAFEYAAINYQKIILLGINVCGKYVIISTRTHPSSELIEKVKAVYAKSCM